MNQPRKIVRSPEAFTPTQPGSVADCTVLLFTLGDHAFALKIEAVAQVIPMLKLVPLPQKHPFIEGFTNIHGQVFPVIGGRQLLGWPAQEAQLNTPILLIWSEGRMIGLIVDEVKEVVSLAAATITGPETLVPMGVESISVLQGVAYADGLPIILIDADYLLNPSQIRELNRVIEALTAQHDREGKSRRRRANLNATLAEQVATIASDLPPIDGQSPPAVEAPQPDQES